MPFLEEFSVPKRHGPPVHAAHNPLARDRAKVMDLRQSNPSLVCAGDDGRGQGVLAPPLEACGQAKQCGFILAWQRHHGHKAGLALGERAGLIHHERVHPLQDLQRLGVLD
jgi:hypothetical protein